MKPKASDYWRVVCAPRIRARKQELGGRSLPDSEIAAAVEAATGKPSDRALVNHWLLGRREPYISQFYALCEKLAVDPLEILREMPAQNGRKHFRGDEIPLSAAKAQPNRTSSVRVLPRRKNR